MIICAVNYGDSHIFARKLLRRLKAAKSSADYDNVRFSRRRLLHPETVGRLICSRQLAHPSGFPSMSLNSRWLHSVKRQFQQTPYNKRFVIAPAAIIFRLLCQNPSLAVKPVRPWQNASRSRRVAKCCERTPRAVTCYQQRVQSESAI
jgi:hypothetical protein